jgi:hypothetical protein
MLPKASDFPIILPVIDKMRAADPADVPPSAALQLDPIWEEAFLWTPHTP